MTTMSSSDLIDAPAWSIRPEQPRDLDQIHEVHRAAFSGPAEAELVDAIRSGSDFLPGLSLVAASSDDSILGHVLVSRIAFTNSEGDGPRHGVLALAPLAVLPPHRGRGIGTALVAEAMAIADARDEPFVAVLGSPPFYGRFGFVPASTFDIQGPYEAAGDAFQVRPRRDGPELGPGTVSYPAMFEDV